MPSIKGFQMKNGKITEETISKLRSVGVDMFDNIRKQTKEEKSKKDKEKEK